MGESKRQLTTAEAQRTQRTAEKRKKIERILCMSTSRLRGRRPSNSVMLLALALALACSSALAGLPTKLEIHSQKLGDAEQKALVATLISRLERDESMPGPSPMVFGVERAHRIGDDSASGWIAPLHVRYKEFRSKYCLLAVAGASLFNVKVVRLPPTALHDTCSGFVAQFVVDANGDGHQDVVHGVRIKSNRVNSNVTEALVYLADARVDGGYCFSAQASSQLSPADLKSAATASASLGRARTRLGIKRFVCEG